MKLVDQAELYLGIFAHRYGYVPTGSDVSLTEMEYNRAVERGLPRLIFLMHADHPLKAADVGTGEGAVKLAALKRRLETAQVINYFKSPADLRARVIAAIVNVQKEWALAESRQKWDESDRLVGWLRPVQYFKDRMAELRWLLQQVAKKQVRLVLVCGRGGWERPRWSPRSSRTSSSRIKM
jgi:hypothetical protein